MKVKRQCETCKATFTARSADVARGWARFCSKSCKAIRQESRTHQNAKYLRRSYMGPQESTFNDAHLFSNEE